MSSEKARRLAAALLWGTILAAGCSPGGHGGEPGCGDDCPPAAVCPPEGPFGYDIGDTLTDIAFAGCDGSQVQLHDLCGAAAGMIVSFYGWCAGCHDYLELAEELLAHHGAAGFAAIVVVNEDPAGDPATLDFCQALRDFYKLGVTTVIDPDDLLEAYGTTNLVILTDRDGVITFKREGATLQAITSAVEAQLAAP